MKDAKGHGSEARSGHEHAIAVDTVKNPLKGLFLGGPSADQAERSLRNRFGYNDAEIGKLKGGGDPRYEDIVARNPSLGKSQISGGQPVASNAHAAAALAGGPKSAPVDVHPAMGLPKGVTMVSMGNPGKMHNAIARAVGEGPLPNDISRNAWKSRGRGK